jgi:adenine deaminase
VRHYGLEVGLLQARDPADFIVVDNLEDFNIRQTYIDGHLVAEQGVTRIAAIPFEIVNNFHTTPKTAAQFRLPASQDQVRIQVMEAYDGQLITGSITTEARIVAGNIVSDPENDVLKIAVVNRYQDAPPALGFIRSFGLREGAIASSVGHDSHNIIAVGADDASLCQAVNAVIAARGGICAVGSQGSEILPLPVAGIMAAADGYEVAAAYSNLDARAKELGSTLASPFMTLSFMGLLVIPALKLSDKGLFNGTTFEFTPVVVEEGP